MSGSASSSTQRNVRPKFEINFLPEYSDEALLDELRRMAALLPVGEHLTKVAYKRLNPKASHSVICRRFGGWKKALSQAGLEERYKGQPVSAKMRDQAARRLSNDQIIAEMKRVFVLVGKAWLTTDDFNKNSSISEDAIRGRFGTFRNGLDAAGIPRAPFGVSKNTDEEAFENIADLWTTLGRPPKYAELQRPPSRISVKIYERRWGTWRKTLAAFIEWANRDSEIEAPPAANPTNVSVVTASPYAGVAEADCRSVRPGLRFRVFKRDNFRCLACGRSPATHLNIELHADHILSVARGGKTTFENLQTLCQDCNLGKGKN